MAGWEKTLPTGEVRLVLGAFNHFSNVDREEWTARPNTILVDSRQLESGEAMSSDFKKIAAREIEEFKAEYRERFSGRDADDLTDEDLLREVMNTVGKPGKLGEQVKCVVSVSMLTEGVVVKGNAFVQMLLLLELAHDGADRIYQAIVRGDPGEARLKPILQPYDTVGSTRYVDFDTARPVWLTDPAKCHLSHVVCDTESWEQKMAQVLESLPEVEAYAKNHNLGFFIPYRLNGEEHRYVPDFLVRMRAADGGLLTLIVEVSGAARKDKAAKVAAARTLWVPAVNNHGGFGRWAFVEIGDPWDAEGVVRAIVHDGKHSG